MYIFHLIISTYIFIFSFWENKFCRFYSFVLFLLELCFTLVIYIVLRKIFNIFIIVSKQVIYIDKYICTYRPLSPSPSHSLSLLSLSLSRTVSLSVSLCLSLSLCLSICRSLRYKDDFLGVSARRGRREPALRFERYSGRCVRTTGEMLFVTTRARAHLCYVRA